MQAEEKVCNHQRMDGFNTGRDLKMGVEEYVKMDT